jgi:hypothetical protein
VDGDAWRVAQSALRLWEEGTYHPSRFPGFPVVEFINAPTIGLGGSIAANLATFFFFVASLVVLRRFAADWNIPTPGLLLTLYAFFPLLWKNSAITLDYCWGLAALLLAARLVEQNRVLGAGILVGLAAGTRMTHIAYLLPFFFLFESERRNAWLRFSLIAIGTTVLCYVPVLLSPSFGQMLNEFPRHSWEQPLWQRAAMFSYRLVSVFGVLGFTAVAAILLLKRKELVGLMKQPRFAFVSAWVLVTLLGFLALPDEREYLIPMIPFALMMLWNLASRVQRVAVTVLVLSHAFIGVEVVERITGQPTINVRLRPGIVAREVEGRRELDAWRRRVASVEVPDSSVVMIGAGPSFGLANPAVERDAAFSAMFQQDAYRARNRNEVYFLYALSLHEVQAARRMGLGVYVVDTAKEYLESFIGYRLDGQNILEVSTQEP